MKEQLIYKCWVGTFFVYSTGSGVRRQKLVKYSRQNMVVISRRQHEKELQRQRERIRQLENILTENGIPVPEES